MKLLSKSVVAVLGCLVVAAGMSYAIIGPSETGPAAAASAPSGAPSALPREAASPSTLVVRNESDAVTTVFIAFGSDSYATARFWPWLCQFPHQVFQCSFQLQAHHEQELPIDGKYLNATLAFGDPVGCGATKAELNINNPKWYDIADVSLVDGYSNDIQIEAAGTILGPPSTEALNEKVFGLYPIGCDVCVARQNPPCGTGVPGSVAGCKRGPDQYHPDVPCQWQGSVMGGGTRVEVVLVADRRARQPL
jgi:hypothetical protein